MTSASTARVLDNAAADIENNKQIVGPLIQYAVEHFPRLDDRLRFMALITFACARFTETESVEDILRELPDAITDIAKQFVEETSTHHTVH
ncbi:hypothetical protein [Vreelandella massiliensis]|uniref:hypothetical protein n=1 Tax=Vreelandella massiliensis TaxID=1816686 RepID=UPI00096AA801|nr:hypothetical protein [Halomonas massiliensis]